MTRCTSYVHHVGPDSKVYPLLEELRKDDVQYQELDSGYYQIDYMKPRQKGRIDGALDCRIEEREVLEFAMENWRKYQAPIEKWSGKKLPWNFDHETDQKSSHGKSTKKVPLLARAREAIEEIQSDLESRGLDPKSDDYRKTMAEGLYCLTEFPVLKMWERYDAKQKKEVFERLGQLNALGLVRLKKFLTTNGGYGTFYNIHSITRDHSGYSINASIDPHTTLFYSILAMAGLSPSFAELTGINPKQFRCGDSVSARVGVGIHLLSGWKVFDMEMHDVDAAKGVFYPMSLRQLFAQATSHGGFVDELVSRKANGGSLDALNTADGFGVLYPIFTDRYIHLMSHGMSGEDAIRNINQFVISHKDSQHPLFLLIFMNQIFGDENQTADDKKMMGIINSHPAISESGIFDYMWLAGARENESTNPADVVMRANHLIGLDPECPEAHFALAMVGTEHKYQLSDSDTKKHFAIAADAIQPFGHRFSDIHFEWGMYELNTGGAEEAKKKFAAVWKNEGGRESIRIKSAYMLAYLNSAPGNLPEAAKWMKKAVSSTEKMMQEDHDGSDAAGLIEWVEETTKEHRFPESGMQTPDLSASIAKLYLLIGKSLLKSGQLAMASKTLMTAASIRNWGGRLKALLDASEACMQKGDTKTAAEALDEARQIIKTFSGQAK